MNDQQEQALAEGQIDHAAPPLFFPVSALKLLVMTTCTLGLYQIYWFYKNWSLIKERENLSIIPSLRGLFAVFFCYSLFRKIRDAAASQNLPVSLDAGGMAAGWIIVSLLWRLPDPYWLITFFSVLFLVQVQSVANAVNLAANPDQDPNSRFSGWNIAGAIMGGLIFLLAIIGTFMPGE